MLGPLAVSALALIAAAAYQPDKWFLAPLVMVGLAACAVDAIAMLGSERCDQRFSLRELFLTVTCVAAIVSVWADAWPFRIRFALSRSALERLALQVERGDAPVCPQRAGLFVICRIERRAREGCQDTVILWTGPVNDSALVHPSDRPMSNVGSAVLLDDDWKYIIED